MADIVERLHQEAEGHVETGDYRGDVCICGSDLPCASRQVALDAIDAIVGMRTALLRAGAPVQHSEEEK